MDDWGVGVAGSRAVDTNGLIEAHIKRTESHRERWQHGGVNMGPSKAFPVSVSLRCFREREAEPAMVNA
jgi:hypothetical protein